MGYVVEFVSLGVWYGLEQVVWLSFWWLCHGFLCKSWFGSMLMT